MSECTGGTAADCEYKGFELHWDVRDDVEAFEECVIVREGFGEQLREIGYDSDGDSGELEAVR